jgi:DNA-binding LacI/PurR family transcriptional regulator
VEAAQTVVQYPIDAGHRRTVMLVGHKGPTHYRTLGYHSALALMILRNISILNIKRNTHEPK